MHEPTKDQSSNLKAMIPIGYKSKHKKQIIKLPYQKGYYMPIIQGGMDPDLSITSSSTRQFNGILVIHRIFSPVKSSLQSLILLPATNLNMLPFFSPLSQSLNTKKIGEVWDLV
jgi:hypothetical protein